ncbi:uncharacterized protein LOC120006584 isoform X2 [Tripterygium wilfordii]|uniref:uncharacterized protein LOC120006584 isoform X2 n=1 Tax=Tripterygium wilfordii TaxID=458696 RepID=UPI0018F812C5|nr:uncharacterized protein LOC120006584 isoform X2 [Tripterygium wilfordii]
MSDDLIVKFVEIYMENKGFRQAELAFQEYLLKINSSTAATTNNPRDLHPDPEFSMRILSFSRLLQVYLILPLIHLREYLELTWMTLKAEDDDSQRGNVFSANDGEKVIHHFRIIQGLFIQPVFTLLEILFFPLQQTQIMKIGNCQRPSMVTRLYLVLLMRPRLVTSVSTLDV